jgi:hypothetical protein
MPRAPYAYAQVLEASLRAMRAASQACKAAKIRDLILSLTLAKNSMG